MGAETPCGCTSRVLLFVVVVEPASPIAMQRWVAREVDERLAARPFRLPAALWGCVPIVQKIPRDRAPASAPVGLDLRPRR